MRAGWQCSGGFPLCGPGGAALGGGRREMNAHRRSVNQRIRLDRGMPLRPIQSGPIDLDKRDYIEVGLN